MKCLKFWDIYHTDIKRLTSSQKLKLSSPIKSVCWKCIARPLTWFVMFSSIYRHIFIWISLLSHVITLTVPILKFVHVHLILVLLNPDIPCLCKQGRSRSAASSEANWSGSALFAIQFANLYTCCVKKKSGSSNMIAWQLEVGVAS